MISKLKCGNWKRFINMHWSTITNNRIQHQSIHWYLNSNLNSISSTRLFVYEIENMHKISAFSSLFKSQYFLAPIFNCPFNDHEINVVIDDLEINHKENWKKRNNNNTVKKVKCDRLQLIIFRVESFNFGIVFVRLICAIDVLKRNEIERTKHTATVTHDEVTACTHLH